MSQPSLFFVMFLKATSMKGLNLWWVSRRLEFVQLEASCVAAGELSQGVPSPAGNFAIKREGSLSQNSASPHPHTSPWVSGPIALAVPARKPLAKSTTCGQHSPCSPPVSSHSVQLFNYQPTMMLNVSYVTLIAPADGPGWSESRFVITSG